ncbi:MAG: nicotinamide mononucleotide transporter [Pseudomonadales bacterium]|nr:nicotinamide mononucleotide transporter [Planctomycetaceae bacterium]MCP5345316.1 nicotinamide mononucleotide transporter [Pseudomonadales bacterium]
MAWMEMAVLFGLLCVWLAARQNVCCWHTGLVQVSPRDHLFVCLWQQPERKYE